MSRLKWAGPCQKMADPEIIMVKAIVSVLATCMLYTGHAYPLVNEADIRCALHHTATSAACVIACPYHDMAFEMSSSEMKRGVSIFSYSTVICDLFM